MKLKKCMALGMTVVTICSLLAGCTGDGETKTETESVAASGSTEAAGESGDLSEYFHTKDHYTLKVMAMGDADTQILEEVSAALSEITEEKIKLRCGINQNRFCFLYDAA